MYTASDPIDIDGDISVQVLVELVEQKFSCIVVRLYPHDSASITMFDKAVVPVIVVTAVLVLVVVVQVVIVVVVVAVAVVVVVVAVVVVVGSSSTTTTTTTTTTGPPRAPRPAGARPPRQAPS